MKKVIVTTTINPPTVAIYKFALIPNWDLIIAGDKKTPEHAYREFEGFMSTEAQHSKYPTLSNLIGWNCIQRRNIAILEAINQGADLIALVDDDNIPLENWGKDILVNKPVSIDTYLGDRLVMDPLAVTKYKKLWHRGFPIQLLQDRDYADPYLIEETFDIQANLWNGNPDIDAICRMEHQHNCLFDANTRPFTFNTFSPFNSQNTILSRRAAKKYFLYPGIGRMDDIWAAYKIQADGFKTVYAAPTVFQDRNTHDLTNDFVQEIIGYTNTLNLIKELKEDAENIFKFLPKGSKDMYEIYQKEQREC